MVTDGDQLAFDFSDPDDPRRDLVHVMMPAMRYQCGGCICGCQGPPGRFVLGTGPEEQWDTVTCPDCRAPGREAVSAEAQRQQKQQA